MIRVLSQMVRIRILAIHGHDRMIRMMSIQKGGGGTEHYYFYLRIEIYFLSLVCLL